MGGKTGLGGCRTLQHTGVFMVCETKPAEALTDSKPTCKGFIGGRHPSEKPYRDPSGRRRKPGTGCQKSNFKMDCQIMMSNAMQRSDRMRTENFPFGFYNKNVAGNLGLTLQLTGQGGIQT